MKQTNYYAIMQKGRFVLCKAVKNAKNIDDIYTCLMDIYSRLDNLEHTRVELIKLLSKLDIKEQEWVK